MKNILEKALTMGKACGIINEQSRDSEEKEKKTTKYGGIAQLGAPATACDDPSMRGNDNLIKTPETQ
ncbi:hypothetical protein DW094_08530 [Ruminococcaceae bacterium AM07-15]|nr:hypothetical protein DW094_08530 [Ruminococcaceae bacterium AM07-15]